MTEIPEARPSPGSSADKATATASPVERHVNAEQAAELLASGKKIVVLDVRTPSEFAQGHLRGAVNVDYRGTAFVDELKKLDRSASYLVHCRSGRRSTAAFAQMLDLGFTSLYHMDGGMIAWQAAGQKVVK